MTTPAAYIENSITRPPGTIVNDDQAYDRDGSDASYSTIARGTLYGQSPGIRADLDRFNSGRLYGIKMIGNRYHLQFALYQDS